MPVIKHQHVRGVVTKEGTDPGDPLVGLIVVLGTRRGGQFGRLAETSTDGDGEFTFDLGALPGRLARPTAYELQLFEGTARTKLQVHGTVRWSAGMDPGVLRLCATPTESCAAPTESVPDPVGGVDGRVYGRVRHTDGTPVPNVTVQLSTLTLTGETPDVSASTDDHGWYQFVPTEPAADFVVKAFRPVDPPEPPELLGGSYAVYAPTLPARVDIDIADERYRQPSEYAKLTAKLTAVLGEAAPETLTLRAAATLSGKTKTPLAQVSAWIAAHVHAAALSAPPLTASPQLIYGLFRMGFPLTKEGLWVRPRPSIPPALHIAADRNLIATDSLTDIDSLLEALARGLKALFAGTRKDALGSVLRTSGTLSGEQVDDFVDAYVRFEGQEADFWAQLPERSLFDAPSAIEARRLVDVAVVAHYWAPAVSSILDRIGTSPAGTVADLSASDWSSIVSEANLADLPDGLDGADDDERRTAFAKLLAAHAELMQPARAARGRVVADMPDDHPLVGAKAFLVAHPEFDLATSRIEEFSGSDTERAHARALQRLYRVAPANGRGTAMLALGAAGLTSAHEIARRGHRRLAADLEGTLGDDDVRTVFRKARKLYAMTLTAYLSLRTLPAARRLSFLPAALPWSSGDFESLFGNIDYCECIDCRSVLGPAAYLFSLLEWLDDHETADGSATLRDVLVGTIDGSGNVTGGRRPDIATLTLSCENTDRALPYIDLVLEVLENAVRNAATSGSGDVTADAAHDSEAEAPAMLASPQHVDADAYAALAASDASFAFGLPFSQPLAEARTFLNFLGVPRSRLLATFGAFGSTTSPIDADDIAAEELGLYDATLAAITTVHTSPDEEDEAAFWPVDPTDWKATLAQVSNLARAAQVTWPEILDLLHTRYINPFIDPELGGARTVTVTADDACDLDTYTLEEDGTEPSASRWARVRQFVRLQRATGWSALDLDKVLDAIGVTALEDDASDWLRMLADLHSLQGRAHQGAVELSTWHATKMDRWADRTSKENPVPSLYERTFLSPSVLPADDPRRADFQFGDSSIGEDPDELHGAQVSPDPVTLADAAHVLQAALGVSGDELAQLLDPASGVGLTVDSVLTLENVTTLYAWSSIGRACRLRPPDAWALASLAGLDPRAEMGDAAHARDGTLLVGLADTLRSAGWSVDELRYVLDHEQVARVAPTDAWIQAVLGRLRDELRAAYAALSPDASELSLRDTLGRVLAEQVGIERAALEEIRALDWDTLADVPSDSQFILAADTAVTPASVALPAGFRLMFPSLPDSPQGTLTATTTANLGTGDTATALRGATWSGSGPGSAALPGGVALRLSAGTTIELVAGTPYTLDDGTPGTVGIGGTNTTVPADVDVAVPSGGVAVAFVWPPGVVAADLLWRFLRSEFLAQGTPSENAPWSDLTRDAFGDDFRLVDVLAKAALLLRKLGLDESERGFWYTAQSSWALLAVERLRSGPVSAPMGAVSGFDGLRNLIRLFGLRGRLPGTSPMFVELLADAEGNNPTDPDPVSALSSGISDRAAWSNDDLTELAAALDPSDIPTSAGLAALIERMDVVRRVGASAATVAGWIVPGGDLTSALSGEVVFAARSRYGSDRTWTDIARPIRDPLRKIQRDALVAYLLGYSGQHDAEPFDDADGLYQHYLIDVSMNPEMLTSRIKQATCSIQLFAFRCMLGIEVDADGNVLAEFDDAARAQWEWMKTYRVWEAARKVFLYPENWIEPELRDDITPFFEKLQGEFAQAEPTTQNAEQATLEYLDRLNQVAHLEVLTFHCQDEVIDGEADDVHLVHVVAATREESPTYWYRRQEDGTTWTPWEKVDAGVEGRHLVLTVYERRLLLFWIQFRAGAGSQDDSTNWELKLRWSEYRDGKWSPAQAASSALLFPSTGLAPLVQPNDLRVYTNHDEDGRLRVLISKGNGSSYTPFGRFTLDPCSGVASTYVALEEVTYEAEEVDGGILADLFGVDSYTYTPSGTTSSAAWAPPSGVASAASWANPAFGIGAADQLEVYQGGDPDDDGYVQDWSSLTYVPLVTAPPDGLWIEVPQQARDFVSQYPFFVGWSERTWFVTYRDVLSLPDLLAGGAGPLGIANAAKGGLGAPIDDVPDLGASRNGLGALLSSAIYPTFDAALSAIDAANALFAALGGSAGAFVHPAFGDGYRFTTFYHPHVCAFIEAVRRDGIFALLRPDPKGPEAALAWQQLETPSEEYDFHSDLSPTVHVALPYPKEDIDFDENGAYAVYNWEIFFHVPFYVATRLMQAGRHDEARDWFHAIFDPGTPQSALSGVSGFTSDEERKAARWWKLKPFLKDVSAPVTEYLAFSGADGGVDATTARASFEAQVESWMDDPFNPHLLARLRAGTYQKAVVMRYVENLIAWGDQLFTRDTIESNNEATQLYVLALQILGDRPTELAPANKPTSLSYAALVAAATDVDTFGNVILENSYLVEVGSDGAGDDGIMSLSTAGVTTYFCVPQNAKLLSYWDTTEDRLFKLRNGMNIAGMARSLPLYEPPIDPALLVRASAAGVDIGTVLDSLAADLPHYRFSVVLTRAQALAGSVRSLAGTLLSSLEKKDAEVLARLRSEQEVGMQTLVRDIKVAAVSEAEASVAAILRSQDAVQARKDHYEQLVANGWSFEEKAAAVLQAIAEAAQLGSSLWSIASAVGGSLPDYTTPVLLTVGGHQAKRSFDGVAASFSIAGSLARGTGAWLATSAGYARRAEEWTFQAAQAKMDLDQISQQLAAAEIRLEIARADLRNLERQIEDSESVLEWMRGKYTNTELYDWMAGQLSTLLFQSYQLALATAKKAERCYQHETGRADESFVSSVYWDSTRKGLLAGERLSADLERMDAAYLDHDLREFELTKPISLALLDPFAIQSLRAVGECYFEFPEAIFDADCPGHYFRRIQSVGLSLACVTGPYGTVNAQLTLHGTRLRRSTTGELDDEGMGSLPSIVTSLATNDFGLFNADLRDPRYLPFERRGAVSRWHLRLTAPTVKQIDWTSIEDVVVHLRYTARDGGEAYRKSVDASLDLSQIAVGRTDADGAAVGGGYARPISLRREFPDDLAAAQDADSPTISVELTAAMLDPAAERPLVGFAVLLVTADGGTTPTGVELGSSVTTVSSLGGVPYVYWTSGLPALTETLTLTLKSGTDPSWTDHSLANLDDLLIVPLFG